MDRNLFRYIWTHSRREQVLILAIVLVSLPFYFVSLDLPKYIVNDAIQGRAFAGGRTEAVLFQWKVSLPALFGGGQVTLFDGFSLSRLGYLLALSIAFLLLVVINGAFKYMINVRKGAMGERLLQRIRHDLVSLLLRAGPEALRSAKPSEMATVVKDEVEPVGGFVGDAFVQPVFLGGQALTALVFILVQSVPLGAIAAIIVLGQGILIPRLRREQLRLSRERQIASRALAGQVGELVEGMAAIQGLGTGRYEMARVDRRLAGLYEIRFALYNRKFSVKFINNFLAQLTPFIFYSLGGYLALRGTLDIGQLVAVIAAYRELPPPVKELIDWDQQRMDVQVKYDQVVDQFALAVPAEPEEGTGPVVPVRFGAGDMRITALRVAGEGGHVLVADATFSLPFPVRVALYAETGEAPDGIARALARQVPFSGSISLAGQDLAALPRQALTGQVVYVGPEPVIFHGSIRDNVAYGLNRRLPDEEDAPAASWLDLAAAGATGQEDLDRRIVAALAVVGLDQMVHRAGLGGIIDPAARPALAAQIVQARPVLRERLAAAGADDLVEPFDPQLYTRSATLGENLLFAAVADGTRRRELLLEQPRLRTALDDLGLTPVLAQMGRQIAATMLDIFADLPPDHFLFEQFSFISAEDLPEYARILARLDRGTAATAEEAGLLMELAFDYIEPRHRLGLLTREVEERILVARPQLRERLEDGLGGILHFYDPGRYAAAAPLRDNILFGRIAHGMAGAEARVFEIVLATLSGLGLLPEVDRLGLDTPAGYGGRLLTPAQRAGVALARALVMRPQILIVHDALASLGTLDRAAAVARLVEACAGFTLVMAVRERALLDVFDAVVASEGSSVRSVDLNSPGQAAVAGR